METRNVLRRWATPCAFALLFAGTASADLLHIDSGAGLQYCLGDVTVAASLPCATEAPHTATVTITPHPAWEQNNPANPGDPSDHSAVWISYKASGYGDSEFQASMGETPVVTILYPFTSEQGRLLLRVWADDTAKVVLDPPATGLIEPVFAQNVCSGAPVGCRPEDGAFFDLPISGGSHMLAFVMYQVGTGGDSTSNPFGLLFTGASVPEPGTLLLLGSALLLLGAKRTLWRR
jgi:hypothetical protein